MQELGHISQPARRSMRSLIRILPWLILLLFLSACDAGYAREGGRWVFITYNESAGKVITPIEGIDPATFEEINSEYARDANQVYFRTKPIAQADPKTFKHIAGLYYKDKDQVFYVDRPVPGADPQSFRRLKYTYWTRDDQNVYVTDNPVNPRDLSTFKQISENWARDSQWFYPQNFGKYLPIENIDPASFEILQGGWAKDCCRVYYLNQVVEGADLATFHTINEFRARDKNWAYLMGTRQRTLQEDLELEKRMKTP